MPKLSPKNIPVRIKIGKLLRETNGYIIENPLFSLGVFSVNLAFMLVLKALPEGISNPFSILWFMSYYVFWCVFYRYYYHLKPYVFSKTVLGSLTPSSKALVLMFLVMVCIVLLPMLPFFLGFDDLYLNFYEHYMQAVEDMSSSGANPATFTNILLGYGVLSLLSPFLICKPYLAWISSLRGHNSSFRKAGDKSKGNYVQFALISALLLYPEAIAMQIDKIYGLNNWFDYTVSTIIFVYTNIIFAKIYDLFYLKH
jgi:hypothetical protein